MKTIKQERFKFVELLAVTLTVLLKFFLMDWLGMRAFYIAGICIFWLCYVAYRYFLDHSILKYWGYKKENLGKSLSILLPFVIVSICITVIYAWLNGIPLLKPGILPVILLYPVWGIIQQFMLVCILTGNLKSTPFFLSRKNHLMIAVSGLFSLIHYPYLSLMVYTFIMEMVFLGVYMRWRNLWAIGFAHGLIATFLLYFVLDRDLWIELFAWF